MRERGLVLRKDEGNGGVECIMIDHDQENILEVVLETFAAAGVRKVPVLTCIYQNKDCVIHYSLTLQGVHKKEKA
jgi:hypothetical protein